MQAKSPRVQAYRLLIGKNRAPYQMCPYHQLGGQLPGNMIRHNSKVDFTSRSTNMTIFKQSCQESKHIGYQQVKQGPLSNVRLSCSAQSMSNQDTKEPSYSKMRQIGLKMSEYEAKRFSQLLFYPPPLTEILTKRVKNYYHLVMLLYSK